MTVQSVHCDNACKEGSKQEVTSGQSAGTDSIARFSGVCNSSKPQRCSSTDWFFC